jgi:methylenetetrahydrofolate dehydrogenase (NADP+)/methenyltetrahydrofolate cyclohydrolase
MTARILDGKALSEEVLNSIRKEVASLSVKPCVAFVRVGDLPASATYVKRKQEAAASVGIESRLELLPASSTQAEIIAVISKLSRDEGVHGILVQSPLPEGINPQDVFNSVPSHKDVDGFSAANLGRLAQGDETAFVACTPLGVQTLLRHYHISTEGKHVVVVGRSMIVGRPLSLLLSCKEGLNATVTSCNKETENLPQLCRSADIIIVAAGCPGLIRKDWVKKGATVIDVGINRIADATKKNGYRIVGDVDFAEVVKVAGAITPVPGGVGPMTVASLMANTVKAARLSQIVKRADSPRVKVRA